MRIGIEAQRIFRKNKHGMDYVVLEEIKELQKSDNRKVKTVVFKTARMCISYRLGATSIRSGNSSHCHEQSIS